MSNAEIKTATNTVIGRDFGVELSGLRLQDLDAGGVAELLALYSRYPVLVIRDQSLTPDDYEAFGAHFGELQDHTRQEFTLPGHPTIYVLSNKVVDGKRIGVHRDGMGWHTDGTYVARPLETTVLYALDVPPADGDTLFADTRSAFGDLDDDTKDSIRGRRVVHSFEYLVGHLDAEARSEITAEQRAAAPEVEHPLVITRDDGSENLYVTLGSSRLVSGMDEAESQTFLRGLVDHVTQDRYVYRHAWQRGDVVVWNNLRSMHRATPYDDERYIRQVHRLWVKSRVA